MDAELHGLRHEMMVYHFANLGDGFSRCCGSIWQFLALRQQYLASKKSIMFLRGSLLFALVAPRSKRQGRRPHAQPVESSA